MEKVTGYFVEFENQENGKKFGFLIKPISISDFVDREVKKEYLKELSTGQTENDIFRIFAQNFKNNFENLDENILSLLLFTKGILYPKIVEENPKDNEIIFSTLDEKIKIFLLKELIKISPLFNYGEI